MNYLTLLTVIAILVIVVKTAKTILKAAKRINLIYNYFIVDGKASSQDLIKMVKSTSERPDPNDGSGCPKESELTNEN